MQKKRCGYHRGCQRPCKIENKSVESHFSFLSQFVNKLANPLSEDACSSIRLHTSAYVSIRQHISAHIREEDIDVGANTDVPRFRRPRKAKNISIIYIVYTDNSRFFFNLRATNEDRSEEICVRSRKCRRPRIYLL